MEPICRVFKLLVCIFALMLWSSPALAELQELKTVGVLESFEGAVLLKHKGFWGETPRAGMTLYHGDKVLTREGTCQIRFADGSLLDVSPNSSVRLAETYIKRGASLVRQRDLRLFLGKVRYASASPDAVRTQLVAPTAVAALRGTDVEFGTDGILATLNQLDGESDLLGDITRVDQVPGATADQVNANPEFKASETAGKVRREYLKAVKSLMTSGNAGDRQILLAAADPILILQIISQTGGGDALANAHKVLLLAALYVAADMNALIEENKALLNNPDERTAERAGEALTEARAQKSTAVQTLNQAKETVRRVNGAIRDALSGDPEKAKAALQEMKPIISQMMADQKKANRVALGKELIVNIKTAGMDEAMTEYEERENARQAEALAEEQAEEYGAEIDEDDSTDELVEESIEKNGDNLEGTDLDEAVNDLETELETLAGTVAEAISETPEQYSDIFELEIPEEETATDRDGDGVPDQRDADASDPDNNTDIGGYAN